MRQGHYLNGILTVNAVLLAGLLWTQVASRGPLVQDASAQTTANGAPIVRKDETVMTSAADQRQKMIAALGEIKASVDATRKAIEGGKLKVEVSNVDQIAKAAAATATTK